ncbi:MAG: hypothetical protein KDG50_07195 [Chromatiales bacterium]|nr:hypothetical protein [Chromatiales bacterium]
MAHVEFTPNLLRHLPAPEADVAADSVGAALEAIFALAPKLRGYLLDDQERLRRHINVFVDGTLICARDALNHRLNRDSRVFVMQALSGG